MQGKKGNTVRIVSYELILILLCVIAFVLFAVAAKGFFTQRNFLTLLREMSIVSVMGIGVTFVLTIGEMDLTIGNLPALCGCIIAAMVNLKISAGAAVLTAFAAALLFALLNAFLTHKIGLPSIVATLATAMVAKGLSFILTDNRTVNISDVWFCNFFGKNIGKFPRVFIWMVIAAVIGYLILKKLKFGRDAAFLGDNKTAAFFSGVSVWKVTLVSFILCALFSCLAGLMGAAQAGNANGGMLNADMMTAFSATFIGGTSMSGGKGNVIGTVFGALFLCILENGLLIMGIATWVLYLINGVIIIGSILVVGKIETKLEDLAVQAET